MPPPPRKKKLALEGVVQSPGKVPSLPCPKTTTARFVSLVYDFFAFHPICAFSSEMNYIEYVNNSQIQSTEQTKINFRKENAQKKVHSRA